MVRCVFKTAFNYILNFYNSTIFNCEGLLLNIYYLWVYVVNLAVGLITSVCPFSPSFLSSEGNI